MCEAIPQHEGASGSRGVEGRGLSILTRYVSGGVVAGLLLLAGCSFSASKFSTILLYDMGEGIKGVA